MIRTLATITLTAALAVSALHAEETAPKTREVKAQDLTLTVPEAWKQQQVSSNLRLAQFAVPATGEDKDPTEVVVFPPFGGSVEENVKRWIAQFQAENRELKMTQGESAQGKYVLVDLAGTYNKPDGPPFLRKTIPAPDYRMVSVMLTSSAGGNYFLKIVGPKGTVAAELENFRKSFGADAAKEQPYEF